ncbi:hypothetical protein [Paenibacillus phytorum]|uniref:hypothetical protein n=1 Tax=Paenibacillus phytorum TaxID=2654977 RepID=UPI0014909110|nr:hypothetical protein [Paenibacillus phytorum]
MKLTLCSVPIVYITMIFAVNYGKTSADPNWQQIKAFDTNGNNKIDIMDLAAIASKITE